MDYQSVRVLVMDNNNEEQYLELIAGIKCRLTENQLEIGGEMWRIKQLIPLTVEQTSGRYKNTGTIEQYDDGIIIVDSSSREIARYRILECDGCGSPNLINATLLYGYQSNMNSPLTCSDECRKQFNIKRYEGTTFGRRLPNVAIARIKETIRCDELGAEDLGVTQRWGNSNPNISRVLANMVTEQSKGSLSLQAFFDGLVQHYIDTGEDLLEQMGNRITAQSWMRVSMQVLSD